MKKTAYLLVGLLVVIAAPAFGQAFTDVPADHWAYDAANQLQKDGVLIGYPDGTFQGKRTITRYEFATAIARMAEWVNVEIGKITPPEAKTWATTEDIKNAINAIPPPDLSKLATKDDVAALRKLIDEFRDEIAALGVDVDALNRDVAALGARVDAIEAELKRVRFTGEANVFAVALGSSSANNRQSGPVVNLDQRTATRPNEGFMRNIGLVKDFDLKIAGRVSQCVTANATINYGNYLTYLGFVDDYQGGPLPINSTDAFFPYYASIDAALGKGSVSVGRFPLQFTPYTLKMIDVDSYTSILKTDDGNYPVDGAKVAWNFGGVDLTLFAAKNDQNIYLANGLTGQPTIFTGAPSMHQGVSGHAVGGLLMATQSAGVRANIGIPWNGNVGLTYYQAWDRGGYGTGVPPVGTYDQARVYGADLSIPIPLVETLSFAGSWTRSDTMAANTAPAGITDVDYLNTAWDAKFSGNVAAVNIAAGYKSIGRNFAAAGAWDKVGRWTNPTGVRGPYAELAYPIMDNLKISLNGEFLKGGDTKFPYVAPGVWGSNKDDELTAAEAAIKWGFTKTNSLDLAYQFVRFAPKTANASSATENYITVGLAHQMSPNAGVRIGYQLISYDNGDTASGPYGADYRGGQGVVQFGVSF